MNGIREPSYQFRHPISPDTWTELLRFDIILSSMYCHFLVITSRSCCIRWRTGCDMIPIQAGQPIDLATSHARESSEILVWQYIRSQWSSSSVFSFSYQYSPRRLDSYVGAVNPGRESVKLTRVTGETAVTASLRRSKLDIVPDKVSSAAKDDFSAGNFTSASTKWRTRILQPNSEPCSYIAEAEEWWLSSSWRSSGSDVCCIIMENCVGRYAARWSSDTEISTSVHSFCQWIN